jgi:hypothetical protein
MKFGLNSAAIEHRDRKENSFSRRMGEDGRRPDEGKSLRSLRSFVAIKYKNNKPAPVLPLHITARSGGASL